MPGNIDEKFNPHGAFSDKLRELLPATTGVVDDLIKKQRVQAMPINYLRGANWINKIVVADEAQNFTFKELTTLITRLGEKIVNYLFAETTCKAILMAKVDLR